MVNSKTKLLVAVLVFFSWVNLTPLAYTYQKSSTITDCDWPMLGKTPDGNRVVPDKCGIKSTELTQLWETRFRFENHAPPVVWDNKIYITDEGSLYCQNISERSTVWKHETEDYLNIPIAIYDGKIYFQHYSEKTRIHKIVCKDALTGSDLWSWLGKKDLLLDFYILAYEHKVYFHTRDGIFHCADANTGKELWTSTLKSPYKPSISNNYMVFSGLVCLNATTGEKVWEKKNIVKSENIAMSENKVYAVVFSDEPLGLYLVCFSLVSGEQLFIEPYDDIHNSFQSIHALNIVGNRLFILKQLYRTQTPNPSNFNGIMCYNLDERKFSWSTDTGTKEPNSLTFCNGFIFAGTDTGRLMIFSQNTGQIIKSYTLDSPVIGEVVIAANKLFVPTKNSLTCFVPQVTVATTWP